MIELTPLEKEVFNFIKAFINENNYPPSIREVADGVYISKSVAYRYIYRLYYKGIINIKANTSRSITINRDISTPFKAI